MRTLWNQIDRDSLISRLERVAPGSRPRWGKFTATKMLAHVNDTLRMSLGQLRAKSTSTPFRLPIIKHLAVYFMPWPKGAPTAPELLRRVDRANWEEERAAFPKVLAAFAGSSRGSPLPEHPLFGRLSHRAWGRLAWRHVDHHFRQFGA